MPLSGTYQLQCLYNLSLVSHYLKNILEAYYWLLTRVVQVKDDAEYEVD